MILFDQIFQYLPSSVSTLVAPPPSTWVGASLTVLQVLASARGFAEVTQPMAYSKFVHHGGKGETDTNKNNTNNDILSQSNTVPAKVGFLIIYGPALLVATAYYVWRTTITEMQPEQVVLVAFLLCLHFGKRVMEALCLHDFSGSKGMSLDVAMPISSYYAFVTFMIAQYVTGTNPVPNVDVSLANHVQSAGVAIFWIGELGNFYHHVLLSQLKEERTKQQGRRYVPPRGGLFEYVATPHYLFEVVSWIGIALVAQQFNAYLEIVSTLGYFIVRSKRTNELYMKSFSKEEWPRSRKNMIPFIY